MREFGQRYTRKGFALPTVLIASIVLLMLLAVSVTATASVRTTIKNQYYAQLAQIAGEAGVEYAKACLAKSANVPQWSDANPLTPSTNCAGAQLYGAVCPNDARCSVTVNGNVRSSFRVGLPALDAEGKATTIPNTGYVEVLRTSNSAVWRTYTQPSVQAAVVPDLCSGSAISAKGWGNAVKTTTQDTLTPVTSAQTISSVNGNLNAGSTYYRRDFTVNKTAVYSISAITPTGSDYARVYIDGLNVANAAGSLTTGTTTLDPGCHTIFVNLENVTIAPRGARFTAAVYETTSKAPLVTTDRSWRFTAGPTVHYSQPEYYAHSLLWTSVRDISAAPAISAAWSTAAASNEPYTRWISTNQNNSGGNYPAASNTYFRDSRDFSFTASTEVKVSALCDDLCVVYIDGQPVTTATWSTISTATLTLPAGNHRMGVRLYNAAIGASGLAVSLTRADGSVVARTDTRWLAANFWESGANDYYSNDNSFVPSPSPVRVYPLAELLIVAGGGAGYNGGGGGAGGGAGGLIYTTNSVTATGTYPVVVGAGGTNSGSGGNSSVFGLTAIGGGGGMWSNGLAGGSGGGSGRGASSTSSKALGTSGQGNDGGTAGYASGQYPNSGGGGAGGPGASVTSASPGTSGAGGAGANYSITGTSVMYAAGGGGGGDYGCSRNLGPGAGDLFATIAVGGSGGNSTNGNGTNGAANSGSGGGGNTQLSNCTSFGTGGNGGSGVVIISYPTGSLTATGGTITTVRGRTIHTFTAVGSSSFIVTAVN